MSNWSRFCLIALGVLATTGHVLAGTTFYISAGNVWKYLDNGTDPGTAWRQPGFNDSAWSQGGSELGYGDAVDGRPEVTVLGYGGNPTNKYISYYFRKNFVVSTPPTNLYLRMVCDDGAAVYLNGQEVYRFNMPGKFLNSQSLALRDITGNNEAAFILSRELPVSRLVPGTNVLCVEVHQFATNSPDLSFNLNLIGDMAPPSTALPFPAGQRGTVTCLESPDISYDIFLPNTYSMNNPLPILYTMHPNGGGMVSDFQAVSSSLKVITVGIIGSQGGINAELIWRELHAVTRDIRKRGVAYDPTAEFAGGFSNGGIVSYFFSRFRNQHVSGVLPMAGWLNVPVGGTYYPTYRVQTNLLVARATGDSDPQVRVYLTADSNFLVSCSAVLQDFGFSGGHTIPPDSVKTACLSWLLTNRVPAGITDRSNATVMATNWRSRIAAGDRESVLRECVSTLMTHPRSWDAYQAERVLDELEYDEQNFRNLNTDHLWAGDFGVELFYNAAYYAATDSDFPAYRAAMKNLAGVTDQSGYHQYDTYALLVFYGYPAPILRTSQEPGGPFKLFVLKDASQLDYLVEWKPNLASPWQTIALPAIHTNATWSADVPAADGFYRVRANAFP